MSRERVVELDGMRGWAAFSVVAYHLVWQIFGVIAPQMRNPATAFLLDGPLDVAVFFVLSGDALSSAYFQARVKLGFAQLLVKRYVRLAIPIFATSLLVWAIKATGLGFNAEAATIVHQTQYFGTWTNAAPTLAQTIVYAFDGAFFDQSAQTLNRFVWTIPVEMRGSALVFLALVLLQRVRNKSLVAAILFGLCLCWAQLFYVSCFFAGMLIAAMRANGVFASIQAHRCAGLVSVDGAAHLAGYSAATPLLADALVFAILCNKASCAIFRTPVSTYLGRISFALYLTHYAILISVTSLGIVLTARYGALHMIAIGLIVVGSLTLCVLLAALFEPIDRIAIRLSQALVRHVPNLRRIAAAVHRPPWRRVEIAL